MYIAFSGTYEGGHKLGDCVTMVKTCYLFAENEPHNEYILSLNPKHKLNFLWDKFIHEYQVKVIYDDFPSKWSVPKSEVVYEIFNERMASKQVQNIKFDTYKELYLRIHGGKRQFHLCGSERGLGRKNIFEYYYFGQQNKPEKCVGGDKFKNNIIYYEPKEKAPERSCFISPLAVSQGNKVFSFDFWRNVVKFLTKKEILVFLNTDKENSFKEINSPFLKFTYQKNDDYKSLLNTIASQRLVVCGNTGIGWFAAATGVPLMAMEPSFFWFMDYRYRECGVESLKQIFSQPNAEEVSNAIINYFE